MPSGSLGCHTPRGFRVVPPRPHPPVLTAPERCLRTGDTVRSVRRVLSLLAGLAVVAALGAVSPVHPFDHLYNRGLRRVTRTVRLPPNAAPRRFACTVAAVWLSLTAAAFAGDRNRSGIALGVTFVAVSGLNAAYVCVPSLVYRALTGRPPERHEPTAHIPTPRR